MTEEFIGFRTIVGKYAGEPLYNMWLTDTRIIRCVDCDHCKESLDGKSLVCALRPMNQHRTDPYGFCHLARPRKAARHAKD